MSMIEKLVTFSAIVGVVLVCNLHCGPGLEGLSLRAAVKCFITLLISGAPCMRCKKNNFGMKTI